MTDPAIVEAAARAIGCTDEDNVWEEIPFDNREWYRELAMCVLVKVTPMIEAAALERAAKVAMDHPSGSYQVATAIRALKQEGEKND